MGKKKAEEGSLSVGNGRSRAFNLCMMCFLLLLASVRGSVVNTLRDKNGDSVVSKGGRFELGFFTPKGSSDGRRYVGIWYHGSKPEVVVWVANRNRPLYNNNGIFAIKDGNLKVLASNDTLWSTDLQFSSHNTTMELMASGNLILKELGVNSTILWQSFENPTDTFLPGMNSNDLTLTSWKSADDPLQGNFEFFKDTGGSRYIIEKLRNLYWVSRERWQKFSSETDGKIDEVIDFLSNFGIGDLKATNYTFSFQNPDLDYSYTRAIMKFSGKIQFLARNKVSGKWDVIWSEPENICSVEKACGTFASCRNGTKHTCRCLPGFEPKSKDEWNSGDYSSGCQRKSEICPKSEVKIQDFFTIYMKPGKASYIVKLKDNEDNCQTKCLDSCDCQAYSEIADRRSDTVECIIWKDELRNIWENADGGGQIHVRMKHSDIGTITSSMLIPL